MEYGIPGGLFGLFFLWGLWEWSKSMKRKNNKKYDVDKDETIKVQRKPDKVARIVYVVIGIAILALIIFFIIVLN